MKYRKRIYYTDSQKSLMLVGWRQGESLHQIASLFDQHHSSARGILSESGGIRPASRRRSAQALSLAEREDIFPWHGHGRSMRAIAASLGWASSSVSREPRRNQGLQGYRANQADLSA